VVEVLFMGESLMEGWYTDPFGRHAARWLSNGQPTTLVRDGDTEAYDDPPAGPWIADPVSLDADPTATGGSDLLRADGAQSAEPYEKKKALWAAVDQAAVPTPSQFDDVGGATRP